MHDLRLWVYIGQTIVYISYIRSVSADAGEAASLCRFRKSKPAQIIDATLSRPISRAVSAFRGDCVALQSEVSLFEFERLYRLEETMFYSHRDGSVKSV
jgi:hypothetical protein